MSFYRDDRILVTGASGWLGRTLRSFLPDETPMLVLASRRRDEYSIWDEASILNFSPTVIFNFAFVTSGYSDSSRIESIVKANDMLNARLEWMTHLRSVRALLTVSSGAAQTNTATNPYVDYGAAKRLEEEIALSAIRPGMNVIVARAWSLSGPFVTRPRDYAFSDFILQAREGAVRIQAPGDVFRRYCSAVDFLSVCSSLLLAGRAGVIESGGPLVELGELARLICTEVNPEAEVIRDRVQGVQPQTYASDDLSWQSACRETGWTPMNLREQIQDCNASILA